MAPKWSDNLTGSQRPFLGIPVRTQGLQGRAQWCHILSQNSRRHWVHGTPKFSVQLEKLDANWTTLRLSIDSLWSRISYRTHSYRWATGDQWYDPVTRWLTEKKKVLILHSQHLEKYQNISPWAGFGVSWCFKQPSTTTTLGELLDHSHSQWHDSIWGCSWMFRTYRIR